MQYEYTLFENMIVELSFAEGPENIDFCPFCFQVIDEKDRVISALKRFSENIRNRQMLHKFIEQHANRLVDLKGSLISVKCPYRECLTSCFQEIESFIHTNFQEALTTPSNYQRRFNYAL